jgi:phage terminase large subunit
LLAEIAKIPTNELTQEEFELVEQAVQSLESTDPVVFARERLGVTPWSRQAEIIRSLLVHKRVAVRSGHKVSKSNSAACIALWWVCHFPNSRVIMTAPTDRQLNDILWGEIKRLYRSAKIPIGGKLFARASHGLRFDDGRQIIGFATKQPERFAGYSGPHMLFIIDEGSGVDEQIYEVIEGNRAGGASLIVFSNPTRTSGTFYEAFRNREGWHLIHVSSLESPNMTGEAQISGLANADWVEEKKKDWGENSSRFQIRVLGNFAHQAENCVIGMEMVDEATDRWKTTENLWKEYPLEIGVDVARFGDDETVIQPVRGKWAYEPIVLHHQDVVAVANAVRQVAIELRHGLEVPDVRVDVIGVGAGVADVLRTFEEVRVYDVNVAEVPTVEPEPGDPSYERLRDQLWFGIRAWLKDGGCLPDDPKLHGELLAPTYKFTIAGKLKVEPKDELKKEKRLKRSPDRADALALAVYKAPATIAATLARLDIGLR